jgi:hypothetical protein
VPGDITGPPSSQGIKIRGPGTAGWRSLESETVKYDHESRGTALSRTSNSCKRETLEMMLQKEYKRKCSAGK